MGSNGPIVWKKKKIEILQRAKKEKNILHKIQRRKGNWIGQIVWRNSFLEHVIKMKGNIEWSKVEEEDVGNQWIILGAKEEVRT
jgi:hypothetical protein